MYYVSPTIILSSTLSILTPIKTDYYYYQSPTLNQPIENLSEKQNQKLIETIFIERMKQELQDNN